MKKLSNRKLPARVVQAALTVVLLLPLFACKPPAVTTASTASNSSTAANSATATNTTAAASASWRAPAEAQPFGGEIRDSIRHATPQFLAAAKPPQKAPNVVIVLADDIGYSDIAPYGSEIRTPNLQALADSGVRYSHFTVTAMCSPTRAALLTGMNQHAVGVGWISEWDFGYPGYRGEINPSVVTLPQILRKHGYSTFMTGKWHLTNAEHRSNTGPFDSWPLQKGFDRFWGILDGEASQFMPHALVSGNEFVSYPQDGSFYLPDAITDHAIGMIRDLRANAPDKPFLLYFSTPNGHAPHHTKPADREKYRGQYAQGWDAVRAARLQKQKAAGLLPVDTRLSAYNDDVQPWDKLTPDQQKMYARFQENYAGYVDNLDQNVGRLMQYLKSTGEWDNTVFIFLSDNGASREVGVEGDANSMRFFHRHKTTTAENLPAFDAIGDASTHPHYPHGWAQTSNTPFAEGKRSTNEGGVRVPMMIAWPGHIPAGGVRTQFHHVTDIAPTILDLLGLDPQKETGQPMHGISMQYSFADAQAAPRRSEQYYEIEGSRGYVAGDWKIVSYRHDDEHYDEPPLRLYNLAKDPSETTDLAREYPEKLKELTELWQRDAERFNVLPLIDVPLLRRPTYTAFWKDNGKPEHFHYVNGVSTVPLFCGPILPNRTYTITAKVHRDTAAQEGVLVARGDRYSGFTLYVQDNRLHFEINVAYAVTHIVSNVELPVGDTQLEFRFDKNNMAASAISGLVKNGRDFDPLSVLQGEGSLWVNGSKVGEAHLEQPVFAVWEGLDVGRDLLSPVSTHYAAPFAFGGRLDSVDFDLQ